MYGMGRDGILLRRLVLPCGAKYSVLADVLSPKILDANLIEDNGTAAATVDVDPTTIKVDVIRDLKKVVIQENVMGQPVFEVHR